MTFIEGKLFQDKRRHLTIYENFLIDFIGIDS
jgi:hypothetical protein